MKPAGLGAREGWARRLPKRRRRSAVRRRTSRSFRRRDSFSSRWTGSTKPRRSCGNTVPSNRIPTSTFCSARSSPKREGRAKPKPLSGRRWRSSPTTGESSLPMATSLPSAVSMSGLSSYTTRQSGSTPRRRSGRRGEKGGAGAPPFLNEKACLEAYLCHELEGARKTAYPRDLPEIGRAEDAPRPVPVGLAEKIDELEAQQKACPASQARFLVEGYVPVEKRGGSVIGEREGCVPE